jgi:hypothetical protein
MSLDTVHQCEFGLGRKLIFVMVDLPGKFILRRSYEVERNA